ncbi:hypothetical protein FXE99_04480 [Vibrio mimicus]|nr:hypothetical protein FXE99_04480 [Vibrio mimicus]
MLKDSSISQMVKNKKKYGDSKINPNLNRQLSVLNANKKAAESLIFCGFRVVLSAFITSL